MLCLCCAYVVGLFDFFRVLDGCLDGWCGEGDVSHFTAGFGVVFSVEVEFCAGGAVDGGPVWWCGGVKPDVTE